MDHDNLNEIDEIVEIDLGAWRVQEVTNVLKRTTRGKTAGVHEVGPDLLRVDIETTASALNMLYNKLWNAEKWSELW